MVEDNGNGTIYIEAGLSTGGSIEGGKLILKDKATGQPLEQFSVPDSGNITVKMPKKPYTVTLDLGKGHKIVKTGPIKTPNTQIAQPPTTEKPEIEKKSEPTVDINNNSLIFIILLVIAILSSGIFYMKRRK